MADRREENNSSNVSNLPQSASATPMHPGFVQLEDHPELVLVVTQAVDQVIASSNLGLERDADLIKDARQAAAAAALTTYDRMVLAAVEASDVAEKARRARAPQVAETAREIADVVADAAVEVHHVEDAAADYLTVVATNAAAELAELVSLEDEGDASTAAAIVVEAVSEAAAINTIARADAASSVAQAAADAAAEVADDAASTALAAEREMISTALERHKDTLETCYEVAAAAAQTVLNQSGAGRLPEQHPDQIDRSPAEASGRIA